MNTITPVSFTAPDGVTRLLRATLGARKRISEKFDGRDIGSILKKFGDGALPEIAYCLMFDDKGRPPKLDLAEFAESLSPEDATELLAFVLAAFSQGKVDPKDAEAALKALQETETSTDTILSTGSSSSDTVNSASD